MIEVASWDEIRRAVNYNKVVIVEYYDPDDKVSKELSMALKKINEVADPSILFLRVSIKRNPELVKDLRNIPCIRVYVNGRIVFEQQGGFGRRDLDLLVLRRSIRRVLRSFNITYKI